MALSSFLFDLDGSVTLALAAFLACAPRAHHLSAQSATPRPEGAERVFAESPDVWFEAYSSRARVSPDGRWAIYSGRILDLQRRREAKERVWPGLTEQRGAAFGPRGDLVLLGTTGGKTGWFTQAGGRTSVAGDTRSGSRRATGPARAR